MEDNKGKMLAGWTFCPPDIDKLTCFEKYLALLVRARGKRGGQLPSGNFWERIGDMCSSLQNPKTCLFELTRAFYQNGNAINSVGNSDDLDLDMCPEGSTVEECYRVLNSFPASLKEIKRSSPYGIIPEIRLKRQMCPESMDRVKCFESFLSGYLQTIVGQERGYSRLPGKRSTEPEVSPNPPCPPSMNRVDCFDHVVAMFLRLMRHRNVDSDVPS